MAGGMKRSDLQALAKTKLEDAELLLVNNRYCNSYYLGGYAIELGLKACISKQILFETIPDKNFINKIHTHSFKELVGLAGLNADLKTQEKADLNFAANWGLVNQWGPERRYESTDAYTAQIFFQAISDHKSGVFKWIQAHW